MSKSTAFPRLFIVLTVAFAVRCASVANGRSERIQVVSDPPGAVVSADCGVGRSSAVTPSAIVLRRKAPSCTLTFSRDGYRSQTVVLPRTVSRAAVASAIPGLLLTVGGAALGEEAKRDGFGPLIGDTATLAAAGAVLGFGAGYAVDFITGALFRHAPGEVGVVLERINISNSEGDSNPTYSK